MPADPRAPFEEYLRQLERDLADLPTAQRAAIRRELIAHLEDAAAERGADPDDPSVQAAVVAQLGPSGPMAAALGAVHGGAYRMARRLARAAGLAGALAALLTATLYLLEFASAAPLATALLGATLAGLAGMLLRLRTPGLSLALTLAGGLTLLGIGAARYYGEVWSVDRLYGALVMVGGQCLLLSAAAHSRLVALPRRTLALLGATTLLLVSFVAPFSALPNPLGLYHIISGGYRYDPRSPLVNAFAASLNGNPVPLVTARLDALLGQTGLDPLDPRRPLVGYTVREIIGGAGASWPAVVVDLRYADGSTRRATIPAIDQRSWHQTGIDRLTAAHRPLAGLPPAGADSPVEPGLPEALPLHPDVLQLVGSWITGVRSDHIVWSPDERALLVYAGDDSPSPAAAEPGLWHIRLDGGAPRRLAAAPVAATWSADGRVVVTLDRAGAWEFAVQGHDLESGLTVALGVADRPAVSVVGDAVYFLRDGMLWRASPTARSREPVTELPDAGSLLAAAPLAVAPDEQRVAYACGSDLCVADLHGRLLRRLPLGYQPPSPAPSAAAAPTALPARQELPTLESFGLAWRPDSGQLAVVTAATDVRGRPELRLISRDGAPLSRLPLGPDGAADTPQWTPDGRHLLLTVYPAGGRRIIAVDPERGVVRDLSRPRWDAVARLAPGGQHMLVWNGRGHLWSVPLGWREALAR